MTRSNGHFNGGGDRNGRDNERDNVTSLEEARRRAAEKAKAEKRVAGGQSATRSWHDWVIGGLVIAMALGYFASFFVEAPGLGGAGQ